MENTLHRKLDELHHKLEQTDDFLEQLELRDEILEIKKKLGIANICNIDDESCESCSG